MGGYARTMLYKYGARSVVFELGVSMGLSVSTLSPSLCRTL